MGELIRVSDARTHTGIRGVSVAYAYVRPGLDQRASRRHVRVVQHTHLQIPGYLQLDFRDLQPSGTSRRRPCVLNADRRYRDAAVERGDRQRMGLLRPPAHVLMSYRSGDACPGRPYAAFGRRNSSHESEGRVHGAHQRRSGLRQLGLCSSPDMARREEDRTWTRATRGAITTWLISRSQRKTSGAFARISPESGRTMGLLRMAR